VLPFVLQVTVSNRKHRMNLIFASLFNDLAEEHLTLVNSKRFVFSCVSFIIHKYHKNLVSHNDKCIFENGMFLFIKYSHIMFPFQF